MDQLISSLDKLLKYKNEDPSRFYTYLSDCNLNEHDEKYFIDSLIPKIYYLYDKQILQKDLVYLSLLASQNLVLLQKFLDYDKSIFVLNIEDPVSLYDYYVYKKKHWLYEIIDNPENEKLLPLKNIYNKFNMIKYVKETNISVVDINQLDKLTTEINLEYLDEFWKVYVEEITRFIDSVKFCKSLKTEAGDSELFMFASKNTLLDTLSNYTDLSDPTEWENILNKLVSNSDQFNIFTGFIILATLINLLIYENHNPNLKKDHINALFENVKTKLIELRDKQLQITLLENIFFLMFHRKSHEFTCKEKEIRFVLFLLKSVTEELKLKKVYDKHSDHYRRLSTLSIYVTDALWRLDLILNTKITPKIEEQLLHYMLAPPESLIHICLKRQNFERAHQVIEVSHRLKMAFSSFS